LFVKKLQLKLFEVAPKVHKTTPSNYITNLVAITANKGSVNAKFNYERA
jgi:hypothetical protein